MARLRPNAGPGRPGSTLPALAALLALLAAAAPVPAADGTTARVLEVIDGDTLRVLFPAGGGIAAVRLIGIDAPETGHPEKGAEFHAEESARALRALCDGRDVSLAPDGPFKSIGRWIRSRDRGRTDRKEARHGVA